MRKTTVLLSMACLCLLPSFASGAVRVTEQQVRNVCGGGLQSSGGAIGCTKKCGGTTCDYGCYKDKCNVIVFRVQAPSMPQMDMNSMASDLGGSSPVIVDGPPLP